MLPSLLLKEGANVCRHLLRSFSRSSIGIGSDMKCQNRERLMIYVKLSAKEYPDSDLK